MYYELVRGEVEGTPSALGRRWREPPARAGAWTVTAGAALPGAVLLLRWDRLDDRDRLAGPAGEDRAAGFRRHEVGIYGPSPAWKAVRRDLPLPEAAVYELRIQRVLNGHAAEAAQVHGESTLPLLQAMGAHVLGVFDLLLGAHRPRMTTFLAWPDLAAQQRAWARLDVEPRFWRRRDEERTRLRRRLFGEEEALLLAALPGCTPQPNFGAPA